MGTPDADVFRAAEIFADIGFPGIEILCTNEYKCSVDIGWSSQARRQLRDHLAGLTMKTVCLTPYLKPINAFDAEVRKACMEEGREVIRLAHDLECSGIRILAGMDVDTDQELQAVSILVQSLGELAAFAEPYGVELWVENHMNSLAYSAAATVRIVEQVNLPNVGIVYDQANLIEMEAEPWEEALRLQAPYIRHVHMKDAVWEPSGRQAKLLGQGQVPWLEISEAINKSGYKGHLCHEYERRWYPNELPIAEIGMAQGYSYMESLIAK
jgi:sugar phosphate isomerase/epimerase